MRSEVSGIEKDTKSRGGGGDNLGQYPKVQVRKQENGKETMKRGKAIGSWHGRKEGVWVHLV